MADAAALSLAKQLFGVLDRDAPRLKRIDDYAQGKHDDPYMPADADDEYRLLAKRSVSNWMPLLVGTPTQALYVDDFRRITAKLNATGKPVVTAEWKHWQGSRLDARQIPIHQGALKFGHAFTLTEKTRKGVRTKGLSAMKTAALYEDPANDDTPYVALTVTVMPVGEALGKARMWDGTNEYAVTFKSFSDMDSIGVGKGAPHGASECPVTRFAASVDLEGRTVGVIEPMIELQNRINQTVFDLLVAQSYAATNVRTGTGIAPPVKRDEDGEPVLDADGQQIPLPVKISAKRLLLAPDHEAKWGSLTATPLGGFIESLDMSIRHLSAISQTPPHHLLGQIANLSAEALLAAETALSRKVEMFRKTFGESWERVFRLAAELAGETVTELDNFGEVLWRDMEMRSLAQSADGLGKLAESLDIPKRGLWPRVPGVTATEMHTWKEIGDEEDTDRQLVSALRRASPGSTDEGVRE